MLTIEKSISKSVSTIIQDGYNKLNQLWPIKHSVTFKTNRGRTRNGYCKKISSSSYEIAVNKDLVKKEDILEVVVHELLHSYPDVFSQGHKGEWKKRSQIVQKTYGIQVQRTNSFERSQTYTKNPIKFRFYCRCCGHKWDYRKKPKWYEHITEVKCPYCKGHTIAEREVNK